MRTHSNRQRQHHRRIVVLQFGNDKDVDKKSADARRLSKAVTVKFSKIDYETLRTRSRKANRRLAEYIRESALKSEVVQPHTEADLKEYRTLVGMANNLNQLTKMAHQDSIIYLYVPIDKLLGEITNVIREYKQGINKKKR